MNRALQLAFAVACIYLHAPTAGARPCATCATISNPAAQDYARSRASRSTTGASCAVIRDATLRDLCRARR